MQKTAAKADGHVKPAIKRVHQSKRRLFRRNSMPSHASKQADEPLALNTGLSHLKKPPIPGKKLPAISCEMEAVVRFPVVLSVKQVVDTHKNPCSIGYTSDR